MRVLLHSEVNPVIGAGSVIQSVAVAEELIARGHSCVLLNKNVPEWLASMHAALPVPKPYIDPRSTWEETLEIIAELAAIHSIDWIFLERPDLPTETWRDLRRIRRLAAVTPVFADDGLADLVVGPFLRPLGDKERARCAEPEYVPLRRRIRELRPANPHAPEAVKNILVWMGGVDPGCATGSLMRILEKVFTEDVIVTVPVAKSEPYRLDLDFLAACAGDRLKVIDPEADFADLLLESDLVLVPPSLYLMEACALGRTVVTGFLDRQQRTEALRIAATGACLFYGSFKCTPSNRARDMLRDLTGDREKRTAMSAAAMQLVDGLGARRIVDELEARL